MNEVYVTKIRWKLKYGETDFWCQILKNKYKRKELVGNVTKVKKYNSSPWTYIAKNWSTLDNYTLWEIGNGKRINVWDERWMEKGLKLREVTLNNSSIQDNIMLSNLLDI